ncbi:MAG: MOSC N-terminal beta barrel domain-containing protein [Ignavibacteriaceae bacterium]|nr:MOSC N-terminal beta barrel domain-containing protein [Ignavibacteriaceae bacterium]
MNPVIEQITIYPVKSMDGISTDNVEISPGGSLMNDRRFALKNTEGKYINGKKYPLLHSLRATFSEDLISVTFSGESFETSPSFELIAGNPLLEEWLGSFFSTRVFFLEDRHSGFPDDLKAYGPTIASLGSYQAVMQWFNLSSVEETHRRFRTNIVLSGCPPFWEDTLFSDTGEEKEFQVGAVKFLGINPCNRCPVPSRHPDTGEPISDFQKIFSEKREETLLPEKDTARFNHYYKFAVNTKIPLTETGKYIRVGDIVSINNY